MEVKDKVALITGAAQGLGRAFMESLLVEGAKVCFCDVNTTQGQKTLDELRTQYGDKVMFQKCDVSNHKDMQGLFKSARDHFGKIDIVCNNAGLGNEKTFWEKTVDVNLKGNINGTLLGIEHMRNDKPGGHGGVIVNISSVAGLNPNPLGPVYSATKAAVIALTRSWAANPEVTNAGIRLNVYCPAFADTALVSNLDKETCLDVSKAKEFVNYIGLMTPKEVAEGFMDLVKDETKNGAIMRIAKSTGKNYCQIKVETL